MQYDKDSIVNWGKCTCSLNKLAYVWPTLHKVWKRSGICENEDNRLWPRLCSKASKTFRHS